MLAALGESANAGPRGSRRGQVVIGVLSLLYGLYDLVTLLFDVHSGLSRPPVPSGGELAWLVTLGMSWHVWLGVCYGTTLARAIGMTAAGLGLLLAKRDWLRVALIGLLPHVLLSILVIPGRIAVFSGRASLSPSFTPPRHVMVWELGLAVAWTAVFALYFFWLWRQLRRMPGGMIRG